MNKVIVSVVLVLFAWGTFASLSEDHKSKLKALYGKINTSSSPHTDPDIASRIADLMREGCIAGANRAVAQKNYNEQQKTYANAMMTATCGCIAESPDLKKGVVDSALLLKKQGGASNEARQALLSGMNKAKQECMTKVMMDMKSKQQTQVNKPPM